MAATTTTGAFYALAAAGAIACSSGGPSRIAETRPGTNGGATGVGDGRAGLGGGTGGGGFGASAQAGQSAAAGATNGAAPSGLQENAPWPMLGHDAQHTGQALSNGPKQAKLSWSSPVAGVSDKPTYMGLAVAADGTIYVASRVGLTALAPDGTQKWSLAGNTRDATPAIAKDGTVYVVFDNASNSNAGPVRLVAVRPDGSVKWQHVGKVVKLAFFGGNPAVGVDGTVYFGADQLYAIAPEGSVTWTFPGTTRAPALGADGTIYVATTDALFALAPDGTTKWSHAAPNPGPRAPSIGADGTVFLCAHPSLVALTPDGAVKWTLEATCAGLVSAVKPDGTLVVSTADAIVELSAAGKKIWSYPSQEAANGESPILGTDGSVYLGHAVGLSPDGQPTWAFGGEQTLLGAAVAMGSDGTLYVGTHAGVVHAFAP